MHEAHTPPRFRRAKLCLDVLLVPLLLVEPRLANYCLALYVPTALRQTLDKLVKPANTDFLHATIRNENMDAGFATGVSPLHLPARLSGPERFGLHFPGAL